jgi:hypothetical protein
MNVFLQNMLGPYHIACKIIMIVIVLQVLLKSFFFLRVLVFLIELVSDSYILASLTYALS